VKYKIQHKTLKKKVSAKVSKNWMIVFK